MDSDRIEGKAKETEGEIQQKWGEAKDKARDTWEDVKDEVEDVGTTPRTTWTSLTRRTTGSRSAPPRQAR